jgi:hypothetical protein
MPSEVVSRVNSAVPKRGIGSLGAKPTLRAAPLQPASSSGRGNTGTLRPGLPALLSRSIGRPRALRPRSGGGVFLPLGRNNGLERLPLRFRNRPRIGACRIRCSWSGARAETYAPEQKTGSFRAPGRRSTSSMRPRPRAEDSVAVSSPANGQPGVNEDILSQCNTPAHLPHRERRGSRGSRSSAELFRGGVDEPPRRPARLPQPAAAMPGAASRCPWECTLRSRSGTHTNRGQISCPRSFTRPYSSGLAPSSSTGPLLTTCWVL